MYLHLNRTTTGDALKYTIDIAKNLLILMDTTLYFVHFRLNSAL